MFDISKQKILMDEFKRDDVLEDNNHIMKKLAVASLYHILYLTAYIMQLTYLVGLVWCILVGYANEHWFEDYDNFIDAYEISFVPTRQGLIDFRHQLLIFLYFAFTTLSTIGLGDYHPISNFERLLCCFIFLAGVTIFSYVLGILTRIIKKFIKLDEEFEDSVKL